ncbi:MAG TPA: hypothetical protein VGY56_20620 [Verrucomicrobiae bacterium]|nr:hypothetical protein [Verrucomicrobiae bacterium]
MPNVEIIISAETAQAAAALRDFAQNGAKQIQFLSQAEADLALKGAAAGGGLNITREGVRALTDPMRGLYYVTMLTGGSFPQFTQAIGLATAGMMGTRAISVSLGVSLSRLLPIVGGISAVIGAGALVWAEYKSSEEEAIEASNDMADSLSKFPELLKTIHDAAQGGILPKETAEEMNQALVNAATKPAPNPAKEGWLSRKFAEVGALEAGPDVYEGLKKERAEAQAAYDKTLPAVQDKINAQLAQLGILLEKTDVKTGKKTFEKNPELENLESVDALQKKITLDNLTGYDKEREAARQKHDAEIDQLNQRIQLAQKARQELQTKFGVATDAGVKNAIATEIANVDAAIQKLNALKSQTDTALAGRLAGINVKEREAQTKQQVESANKIREQGSKDFAADNKQLDDQITNQAATASKKRDDLWAEEYKQRLAIAQSALYSGEIDEKKYNEAVQQAQTKMLDGQKAYNDELRRTAQLKLEVARGEITGKLEAIRSNPNLTEQQKAQRSIPLMQDLHGLNQSQLGGLNQEYAQTNDQTAQLQIRQQINRTIAEQWRLEEQLRQAQGQGGWQSAYIQNLIRLQNQWGDLATSVSNGAFRIMERGVTGIANALTGMILGTEKAGVAFARLGLSLLENFISTILEAVIYAEIALPILTALGVVSGGATAEAGAAATATALTTTLGIIASFDRGGYTGDGGRYEAAGIVHRGEYVFSAPAVQRIGVRHLENLHQRGYANGGSVGGPDSAQGGVSPVTPAVNIKVINVGDYKQAALEAMASPAGEKVHIVHALNTKQRVGITT